MESHLATELELIACHEASHYVVAYKLYGDNHGFDHASAIECCVASSERNVESREESEKLVVFLYAGYFAEIRLDPRCKKMAEKGAGDDCEKVCDEVKKWKLDTDKLKKKTEKLVNDYWKQIERLAAWVLAHGFVGREVADLICAGDEETALQGVKDSGYRLGPRDPKEKAAWHRRLCGSARNAENGHRYY